MNLSGAVLSVSKSDSHTFNKYNCEGITLVQGLGVDGDAHSGVTVKHRSRVAQNPDQPNLRQVHLMHAELFEELLTKGFTVTPGQMGENITTSGIDLLALPQGAILKIGAGAEIQVTGLRNPCHQLETIQKGLMKAVLDTDSNGSLIRKAGIMGIVLKGGAVVPGDQVLLLLPELPHLALEKV